jgi:hypothetical protein
MTAAAERLKMEAKAQYEGPQQLMKRLFPSLCLLILKTSWDLWMDRDSATPLIMMWVTSKGSRRGTQNLSASSVYQLKVLQY